MSVVLSLDPKLVYTDCGFERKKEKMMVSKVKKIEDQYLEIQRVGPENYLSYFKVLKSSPPTSLRITS